MRFAALIIVKFDCGLTSFRNEFDTRGPMSLFNIARRSEITSEDLENAKQIVDFYVGSKGI